MILGLLLFLHALEPSYRGKGFGSEATRLMMAYGESLYSDFSVLFIT